MVSLENDVVLKYDWLVKTIVAKYFNYSSNTEDLYQVGVMALIKAYNNFNESYNVKFSTYAYPYVLGEISKYVKNDRNIHISHDVLKLNIAIDRAKDVLCQKLMREPTVLELSLFLGIDEEKIIQTKMNVLYVKSLDSAIGNDFENDFKLYDSIKIEEPLYKASVIDLKDAIEKLDKDEKKLIYSRYFDELTQQETSSRLGMSQVQVSRKETKILRKLKSKLKGYEY